MALDGALHVIDLGFEVEINAGHEMQFDVNREQRPDRLSTRQRFTLAHEVGHTLFYDQRTRPPVLLKDSPKRGLLEHLTHIAARRILVPEFALKAKFGGADRISIDSIIETEKTFDVSSEVAVRRLQEFRPLKSAPVAIVFAKFDVSYNDATILAMFGGEHVRPIPPLFSSLRSWAGNWLKSDFWALGSYSKTAETRTHKVRVQKAMYSADLAPFEWNHTRAAPFQWWNHTDRTAYTDE